MRYWVSKSAVSWSGVEVARCAFPAMPALFMRMFIVQDSPKEDLAKERREEGPEGLERSARWGRAMMLYFDWREEARSVVFWVEEGEV